MSLRLILCLKTTMAESNGLAANPVIFLEKPQPALHTQCSQVYFKEKLSTKAGERAAQCLNVLLRQNSKDDSKGSVGSLPGRWPRAKK